MPERSVTFRVRSPIAGAVRACEHAMKADRWQRRDAPSDDLLYPDMQQEPAHPPCAPSADIRLWCVEARRGGLRGLAHLGNQVVAEVALYDRGPDGTDITVGAANYGVGPIQERHLQRRLAELTAAIRAVAH